MDTSKTYIKMCNCEAVQGLEPKDERGDDLPHQFYADEYGDIAKEDDGYYYMIDNFIWLPRQDQLQEILIIDHPYSSLQLVGKFADFMTISNLAYLTGNVSMEQLWLAFVMKEKYNKLWTGNDWKAQ